MSRSKIVSVRSSGDLAEALGLDRAEGAEFDVRGDLNTKIIDVVKRRKLTHAEVAHLAGTSRTRVAAVMNRNTIDVSTDLMLRILASLGVGASIKFHIAAN